MSLSTARTRWRGVRTMMVLVLALGLALALAPDRSSAAPGGQPGPSSAAAPGGLPDRFEWSSSGPLISPRPDAQHDIVSVKDPSVVHHNGRWHVYMTTASRGAGNWNLAYTSFTDWSQASAAPHYYLDTGSAIGPGYRAAPQVFYFAPRDEWYLVYQTGLPSFSTTSDPGRPETWSAPRNFQDSMPQIIRDNIGDGHWVDFWVICDDAMCYLYSSDDNGQLYRAETTIEEFPNGFRNTRIDLQDSRFALFEGGAVYRVKGTDTYLLLVEAIDGTGARYYRSWTSQGLNGQWQPLAATESNPFARANNVTFPGGAWTTDISHGELIRDGVDQTLTIDPCDLRMLYQGRDPSSDGSDYSQLPYRLGLLTQTNSACGPGDPGDGPGDPGGPAEQCAAEYRVANQWQDGFQAEVTVRNTGTAATTGWRVDWNAPAGTSIGGLWSGTLSTTGQAVTVRNAAWNGRIEPGSSVTFGFTATGSAAVPSLTCTASSG